MPAGIHRQWRSLQIRAYWLIQAGAVSRTFTINALREARLSGEKLAHYPGPAPASMAEAFDIQSDVRTSIGWTHVGWKIGCTSERAQKALKADGPFPGPIYRERLFPSGTHVETLASNSRTTEPEIAFTMARDLVARGEAWSVDEVLDGVAMVHPSIEIVNPRLPKGFNDVVEWYVADGGLSHALVLGQGVKPLKRVDYARITNRVSLNGVSKYSGIASNALGGPELALTWLANNLIEKGLFLQAGDVVTTGVITEVFDTSIGDHVEATYDLIGKVSVQL
jgi:2-keto-4-pentenoate hydratase